MAKCPACVLPTHGSNNNSKICWEFVPQPNNFGKEGVNEWINFNVQAEVEI